MINKNHSHITLFLVSCITWIILAQAVVIYSIYRKIIDIILSFKLKKKYGGLLDSADAAFLTPDHSMYYITNVIYVKSKDKVDLYEVVRNIFQKKIFNHPDQYMKLTSRLQEYGGYAYWLKDELDLSDTVRPLIPPKTGLTEDYLKEFTGKLCSANNFIDGVCWDVHVSKLPLLDYKDDFRYVLVSRIHHSIADGTSLVALFIKLLGDDSAQNYGVQIYDKLLRHKSTLPKFSWMRFIQRMFFLFDLMFLALGRLMMETWGSNEKNALHGNYSDYCGKKVVVWAVEDQPECIPTVKFVKTKLGTPFSVVIATAVVDSLKSYFITNSEHVPDHISGVMPVLLRFPKIEPLQPVTLENKASAVTFKFLTRGSLVDNFKANCHLMNKTQKTTETLIIRFLVGYLTGCIPLSMQQAHIGFKNHTLAMTNIPGGSQINMRNGCVIEKVVPVAPNLREIGLSVAILSYDDRLQVGVMVDKSLQESQKKVQGIADGILDVIKKLHEELQRGKDE